MTGNGILILAMFNNCVDIIDDIREARDGFPYITKYRLKMR